MCGQDDHNAPPHAGHNGPVNCSTDWPKVKAMKADYPDLAAIYTAMLEVGLPNAPGPCLQVPSGLNVHAWEAIKTGHPDDTLVLDGVQYGFTLQYTGPPNPTESHVNNHSSANTFPTKVREYIRKELEHGAMLGPFKTPPFEWVHISPIMTREKAAESPEKRWIIVDLSFPEGNDVNSHIVKNMVNGVIYHHALPTMDDLDRKVQERDYECYAYAVDIACAYRNFRSDPLAWPLLGVATHGHTYTDVAMPFGRD